MKRPAADCRFCEYRNWTSVNFLLNCGCRAAAVRSIFIQDVSLQKRLEIFRYTKNDKIQVLPLCPPMLQGRFSGTVRTGLPGGARYLKYSNRKYLTVLRQQSIMTVALAIRNKRRSLSSDAAYLF